MSRRSKGRGPKTKVSAPLDKNIPKSALTSRADQDQLSWKFQNVDQDGPYSWTKLTTTEKLNEVLDKLKEFEGKNWSQLQRGGSHRIPTQQLEKEAQDRLKAIKLDEQDELWSMRLTGTNRIWAYRLAGSQNTLRLLWWDPSHKVYKTEKDRKDRKKRKNRR